MSLYLRCHWMPPPNATIHHRLAEAAHVASGPLADRLGPKWFKLGRSRRSALHQEVPLARAHLDPRLWKRVPLGEGESYRTLAAWNGGSDDEGANVTLFIHEPPLHADILVFTAPIRLAEALFPWADLTAIAREIANALGGLMIVSSTELHELAERRKLPRADSPAHALFWGVDRSARALHHRWLAREGHAGPFAVEACASWDEARAPHEAKLRRITEALAAVTDLASKRIEA